MLQIAARRQRRAPGRKAWVVIAASLVVLSTLGTGPRSDVLAHFFGLLVGGLLAIGPALAVRRPPDRLSQWLLALTAGGEGRGVTIRLIRVCVGLGRPVASSHSRAPPVGS